MLFNSVLQRIQDKTEHLKEVAEEVAFKRKVLNP